MTAIVVIPTYDEFENLPVVLARTLRAAPDAHVLVVDDDSPDGTGLLAAELAATDPRIHVLHRVGKQGLGPAYLAGFAWALDRDYDVIVEMDADGSHHPEYLPRLIGETAEHDLVLGSRWTSGGAVRDWPLHRLLLSRGGNAFVRLALGIGVHDATGGFRAYRAGALRRIPLHAVASQGYCFQVDLLRRTLAAGLSVVEVPIVFTEREHGASKMTARIVLESLLRVSRWGVHDRGGRLIALGRRPGIHGRPQRPARSI